MSRQGIQTTTGTGQIVGTRAYKDDTLQTLARLITQSTTPTVRPTDFTHTEETPWVIVVTYPSGRRGHLFYCAGGHYLPREHFDKEDILLTFTKSDGTSTYTTGHDVPSGQIPQCIFCIRRKSIAYTQFGVTPVQRLCDTLCPELASVLVPPTTTPIVSLPAHLQPGTCESEPPKRTPYEKVCERKRQRLTQYP